MPNPNTPQTGVPFGDVVLDLIEKQEALEKLGLGGSNYQPYAAFEVPGRGRFVLVIDRPR